MESLRKRSGCDRGAGIRGSGAGGEGAPAASRGAPRGGKPGVLIVGEDAVIRGALSHGLAHRGFSVHETSSGAGALELVRGLRFDLVLLNLMPSGESGARVCERIRREDPGVAIVVVTAGERDRNESLKAGANDFLLRPFGMRELVAKISANTERGAPYAGARPGIIKAGDLKLDTENCAATVRGEPLNLRLKEFEVLAALAARPGELMSREQLAREVWGHAWVGRSRAIDVHVRRIRAALAGKSDYEYVHTVRGLGYRFEARLK